MAIGFKEWEVVCRALERGEQSILLRKGGIAEGREGFRFQHREFYLFPTFFHEQAGKVRPEFADAVTSPPEAGGAGAEIEIGLRAVIDFHCVIEDWEIAASLEPFHIWRPEEIRKRFESDEAPGISLAFIRIYRLRTPWRFLNAKAYGGCRSWVDLPEPAPRFEDPVLADTAHAAVRARIEALVA